MIKKIISLDNLCLVNVRLLEALEPYLRLFPSAQGRNASRVYNYSPLLKERATVEVVAQAVSAMMRIGTHENAGKMLIAIWKNSSMAFSGEVFKELRSQLQREGREKFWHALIKELKCYLKDGKDFLSKHNF